MPRELEVTARFALLSSAACDFPWYVRGEGTARLDQSPGLMPELTCQNFHASPPKKPRRGPYCGAKTPTPVPLRI